MLSLPTKEMIKAMVLTQGKVTDSDDFIEGKGGALVMLLHGDQERAKH
jgi:hypothetical protein